MHKCSFKDTHIYNDRKLSFFSCAMTVSCRQPWASLPIIIAHDPSACWTTWPDSPDRAPTVSLHMPELSLRDTALSEGIRYTHEKQPKRIQPAQQRTPGLLHTLRPTLPCKWTPISAQISHKYPVWRFWHHLMVRIHFARIQDWSLNPCLIFGGFRENKIEVNHKDFES